MKLVSWDQNTDCCIWNGVVCNLAGQVTGLDLSYEALTGGFNDSSVIFRLKKLQRLNLAYNNFSYVRIPSRLGNLTSLVHLNLSNSHFSGQIPATFSQMTRLKVLDLTSYGEVSLKLEKPNLAMLVRNLQLLTYLYLDGVNISSQKSNWGQALSSSLPNLKVLSLSACCLSGPIDESFQTLQSLSILDLSYNNLSTDVPDFFANFTNLTSLSFSCCNLRGNFPTMVLQLPDLEFLDLWGNTELYGSLHDLPMNGIIQTLTLSMTNFSGVIPEYIGDLKMLSTLDLYQCRFSGRIPQSIENLTDLSYLDLSYNNFTGRIPSFQLCKNISHINLSLNSLSGSISSTNFLDLHNLDYIDLSFNAFGESLPSSLFAHPLVRTIYLSNNYFVGSLNNFSVVSTSLLERLDLSSNRLEGEIPVSLYELNLSYINIANNHFRGKIPSTIGRLRSLYFLDISCNEFTGSIQSSIGDLKHIEVLDLSRNKLVGEIPKVLSTLPFLNHFNVSYNQLEGKIPAHGILQTFSIDSYTGNTGLCGYPLTKRCTSLVETTTLSASAKGDDNLLNDGDAISIGIGFFIGLNIIILPLICSERWYGWYYKHVDRLFFKKLHQYYERRNTMMRAYRNPIRRL